MKLTTVSLSGFRAVAVITALGFSVGCGGSPPDEVTPGGGGNGQAANFTALRAAYTSPSGTFSSSDIPAVAAALSKAQASSNIPVTESTRRVINDEFGDGKVDVEGPATLTCTPQSGGIQCSCPSAGYFTESGVSSSNGVAQGTVSYVGCVFSQSGSTTATANGTISFADYTTAPQMLIYSGTVDETIAPPGSIDQIDMNYAVINGVLTFSVSVSNGNVLVTESGSWDAATESGTFTVTDSTGGSATCTVTNGSGSCT